MATGITLDHVAIATHDVTEVLGTLVGEFGAQPLFGGLNFGFRAMQLDCGKLRVELLEPYNAETNPFLTRFLDANGPGPHHLTFKTPDIRRDLDRLAEAGYRPVGVSIDNPMWKEAFIHPSEAGGTVIQIAQSELDPLELDPSLFEGSMDYGPSRWWPEPPPPPSHRAELQRVVVTSDRITRTLELYGELLGGERSGWDEGWVELSWPGEARIRIEQAAGRSEGIERIEWTHEGPHHERTVEGTKLVFYPGES